MNGYLARVTRCAGTTSEEGGSYSSNDMVCASDEGASVATPPATSASVRLTASIVLDLPGEAVAILRRGPECRTRVPWTYCKKLVGLTRTQRLGPLVRRMMFGHPALCWR